MLQSCPCGEVPGPEGQRRRAGSSIRKPHGSPLPREPFSGGRGFRNYFKDMNNSSTPEGKEKKNFKEENKDLMGLRDSHTIGKGGFQIQPLEYRKMGEEEEGKRAFALKKKKKHTF